MPVDSSVKNIKGLPAMMADDYVNIPAATYDGLLFIAKDTQAFYYNDGGSYVQIGGTGGAAVSGSGTTGTLPLFTGSMVIGDSVLTQSGGNLITAGSITAGSLIKSGGTSSQFLKADGSVDSSTYVTAASSATFTNKAGNISQWTNDSGYITAAGAATLTNKAGNISQWTNDSAYITAASSDTLTNKAGNISQWTNDSGYLTSGSVAGLVPYTGATGSVALGAFNLTATALIKSGGTSSQFLKADGSVDSSTYVTAASSATFTNKAGNISQWTNDSGYITSASLSGLVPYTGATGSVALGAFNLTATALIKSGGTSSQFLKADGSVDSSTYVTAAGAATFTNKAGNISQWTNDSGYITSGSLSGLVPYTGATGSVNLGAFNLTGTTITGNSIVKSGGTSSQFLKADGSVDSSTYVTAASSATFTNKAGNISQWTNDSGYITSASLSGLVPYTGATGSVNLGAFNLTATTISGAGTGLTGTAAGLSIGGNSVTWNNQTYQGSLAGNAVDGVLLRNINNGQWALGLAADLKVWAGYYTSGDNVSFGTVTGTSIVKSGGTSSQFLKADGSVDSSTYITAASSATFTNKAGNISQWTNDSGYITSASLTGLVPYTGATGAVNLGSNAITAGAGTFTGDVILPYSKSLAFNSISNQYITADANYLYLGAGNLPGMTIAASNRLATFAGDVILPYSKSIAFNSISNQYITADANYLYLGAGNLSGMTISSSNQAAVFSSSVTATNIYLPNTGLVYFNSGDAAITNSGTNLYLKTYNGSAVTTALTINGSQILTTASRLNVNGAADNSNFALNVSGCAYMNSFSPTAFATGSNQTLGANCVYIATGAVTFTLEDPASTNKIFFVRNDHTAAITINSFNGTTVPIRNLAGSDVASISLAARSTAMFVQGGTNLTYQIL